MSQQTLLLVDCGNTAVKFQCLHVSAQHLDRPQTLFEQLHITPIERMENTQVSIERLRAAWKTSGTADSFCLSWVSVGPPAVQQAVRAAYQQLSGSEAQQPWQPCTHLVFKAIDLARFENHYVIAEQLGADRWVSALGLACQSLIAPGETHMIVSAGTATTVDLIKADHRQVAFLGGWILPGIGLMNDTLRVKTRDLDGLMSASITTLADADATVPTDSRTAISQGIGLAQTGFVSQIAKEHHVTKLWLHGGNAVEWRTYLSVLGKESGISLTVHDAPHLAFAGLLALQQYRT